MTRVALVSAISAAGLLALAAAPALAGGTPINGPYSQGSSRSGTPAAPQKSPCMVYLDQNQYVFDRMAPGPNRDEAMQDLQQARAQERAGDEKGCVSTVEHALELTRR